MPLSKPPFPVGRCTLSDDWSYRGMKVIYMENDFLRIGILAGRGSDIFEFRYKPMDVDFMLRLSKGILHPGTDFSQHRGTSNQFEDYYYGGWQEILPNSPAFNYRGAALGQHGEVSLTPWKYAILEDSPERVCVKLWARPLRVPLLIEKTLTLEAGQPYLLVKEQLTNESDTHLDIAWGHHVAFGLPFLKEGGIIKTNALRFEAEPLMPDSRRFRPGLSFDFPQAQSLSGQADDASQIPPEEAPPYSDLAYLWEFPDKKAFYSLESTKHGIGFRLDWDADIFKCVWYWQERYGTQDAPWWGSVYAVALEPWTNRWNPDPEAAIAAGDWLHLQARQTVQTELIASAVHTK